MIDRPAPGSALPAASSRGWIRRAASATTVGRVRTALYRWFEQHVWAGDAILGVLLFGALAVDALNYRYTSRATAALLLVSAVPMFVRRSAPELSLLLGTALLLLNLWLVPGATVAVALAPLLVHAAVTHARQRFWGRLALTLGLFGSLAAPLRWGYAGFGYAESDHLVLAMAVGLCAITVVAAFVIGERQRDRADNQASQLRALAERAAMLTAERDQRARIAAVTERTRIARELHDIVAHSLSVVIVQADGAAAAVAARPELAPTVLQTIAETSREALAEMRRLVSVLRTDPADSAGYAPAQGIRDLPALVEQVRQAGLAVRVQTGGAPRPVPAGLDLTVYRLVQEALTNVLKHAGPAAAAAVELDYRATELGVQVTDDGRGAAVGSAATTAPSAGQPVPVVPVVPVGHGLLGMQERVSLQGGRVSIGPRVGGGFAVKAWFPLPDPVRTPSAGLR